jgi:hypothetical protein
MQVFCRGRHLSYQRGKRNTNPNTSLIKIEGVDDTNAAKYVQPSAAVSTGADVCQLLPRKEGRLRLPSTKRGQRIKDQSYMGQSY